MDQATAIVENSEIAVWTGLWEAIPENNAQALGMSLEKIGSATALVMQQMPDWFFNRVIGFGLNTHASEELLDNIIDIYTEKNLPLGISLSPQAQPANISDWLQQRGFSIANNWAKMIRGAESPPAIDTDLQIMKAGKEHALLVGNLICAGFGMPDHLLPVFASLLNNPNNHVYLATDDDVPIGVGVLTVHNDIGHLNTATTMQAYRGRGVQGALMAHRINEGIRMGCQWFATETGILPDQPNPSYNNMVRYGFKEHYQRPNFARSP